MCKAGSPLLCACVLGLNKSWCSHTPSQKKRVWLHGVELAASVVLTASLFTLLMAGEILLVAVLSVSLLAVNHALKLELASVVGVFLSH